MNEVGMQGETNEIKALKELDRSTDGTLSFTRAQNVEQDLIRDAGVQSLSLQSRANLMVLSASSPAILRGWSITPLDDRLLVQFASYKEDYVCPDCKGKCHGEQICQVCSGNKYLENREFKKCFACDGKKFIVLGTPCGRCAGQGGVWEEKKDPCLNCSVVGEKGQSLLPSGFEKCHACSGSGLAPGVLAIPDESKQDHSYGDVLVCGADIYDLRPGDRVLFSKMAGIYVKGDNKNCCLLRRGEIMGYMRRAG